MTHVIVGARLLSNPISITSWIKNVYWRSLELLCQLDIPSPARLLEIGGGQMAVLFKKLFNDDCVVADLSERYVSPLRKEGLTIFSVQFVESLNPVIMKMDSMLWCFWKS